jgi:NADH:ubiquinone oxidoreductase subunit 6 (subunit J)
MVESALLLNRFIREHQKANCEIRLAQVRYSFHFMVLLLLCVLMFLCFIKINGLGSIVILFLAIPLLFSESIVLYSINRNEKWTYFRSMISAIGICVLFFIYVFYISDYIIS